MNLSDKTVPGAETQGTVTPAQEEAAMIAGTKPSAGSLRRRGMPMQLSRRIPARLETITFDVIKRDFSHYTDGWRRVRAKMKNKLDACGWCRTSFSDGDTIALGFCHGRKNMLLCQACAEQAIFAPNAETQRCTCGVAEGGWHTPECAIYVAAQSEGPWDEEARLIAGGTEALPE